MHSSTSPSQRGGRIRIGISGWRYPPWRGVFYPQDLAQRRELEFAASRFPTVELNGSFYSLQRPKSWHDWDAQTPQDFVFAVKGSRFITHLLRLREIERPLANFFASGVLDLGAKLGPLLWQFPPNLVYHEAALASFFAQLPHDTHAALGLARGHDERVHQARAGSAFRRRRLRHCMEVRHESFRDDRWSPCCGGTTSRWWSPTPPASGRIWKT